jgi:hypothetical protein
MTLLIYRVFPSSNLEIPMLITRIPIPTPIMLTFLRRVKKMLRIDRTRPMSASGVLIQLIKPSKGTKLIIRTKKQKILIPKPAIAMIKTCSSSSIE